MSDLTRNPEHITLFMVSADLDVLGATAVPLRQCRAIKTETDRIVGWYIERSFISVTRNGVVAGFLALLPDGERVIAPISDIGVQPGRIEIGQIMELEELRLVHPQARAPIIRSTH
jgi:hypothetical protein